MSFIEKYCIRYSECPLSEVVQYLIVQPNNYFYIQVLLTSLTLVKSAISSNNTVTLTTAHGGENS